MTDLAVRELQAGSSTGPSWEMLEIARIYTSGGEYFRALQALEARHRRLLRDGCRCSCPQPYWQGLFPRPYWDALRRYSEENGLDPYLVASLIRQESEFNPSAISHANAYGLMQLLPRTGKGEAKKDRAARTTAPTRCLIPRRTSSWAPTISARWSTTSAARWSTRWRPITPAPIAWRIGAPRATIRDIEEFVESIPFTETREYVQAIVRNAEVYKRVYGTP